jgi:hypothetical protein
VFIALCCSFPLRMPWHPFSFFLFVPAVLLAAALFGRGPALYATAMAVPVAVIFFIAPIFGLRLTSFEVPPLVLYLLLCGSVVAASEWLRGILSEGGKSLALAPHRNGSVSDNPAAQRRVRLDGIDFWRGFVLCTIFINHMPGNMFENYTFRNIGFSDAAEAFIYLSGISMALAYGPRFVGGDRLGVFFALARRAAKLYAVHIALSLAGIAIFIAGAITWHAPALLTVHGRDLYISDASLFLFGVFSLGHQLGYFNILPLYIVLIAWAPLLMWLANIDRRLMLALSACIYLASRYWGWNFPSWPVEGTWFLNPFTWQLMLAIGLAVGPMLKAGSLPLSRRWFWASAAVLAVGAFIVTNGFGLTTGMQDAVHNVLDLNKNNLGLGRLLHFLALAYFVYCTGLTARLRNTVIFQPFAVLGRHSLLVFAFLSLFDAIGQVLIETLPTTAWLDAGLVLGGLAVLYSVASLADAVAARERKRMVPAIAATAT